MVKTFFVRLACVVLLASGLSLELTGKTRQIILDTDWWTDVDDAMCVRLLAKAHRQGSVRFAGLCLDAVRETSVPSLAAFLSYENAPEMPLGADMEATDYNGLPCYHELLVGYGKAHNIPNSKPEDAVRFYRRLLSEAKGKVDILCVGYPNALARLLQSPSDEFSKLKGLDLVRKKVRHLWMMAGNYPDGSENNFKRTPRSRAAGAVICSQWPTEITFLGYEVGVDVLAGASLGAGDLLHQVVCKLMPQGRRSSWDPLTAWVAILGDARAAGYELVRGINSVDSATGANVLVENKAGRHYYLKRLHPVPWYEAKLDSLLLPDGK